MLFVVLGVLSSVIFVIGDIPYFLDALKGKTKPHRVTWGLASLLNTIGFANQWASGGRNSLWLFGAGAIVTGAIFITSFRNGVGGYAQLDIVCLALSVLGLILWAAFNSPLLSIFANLVVDAMALLPTIVKAKRAPETETRISWLVGTFSVLLATISVGKLDFQLLVLPGTAFILQSYMVYVLYVEAGRRS